MTRRADVSAVIPTIGRPSLKAAVASCLAQEDAELEVIVVADLPADPTNRDLLVRLLGDAAQKVEVVFTGGRRGGAAARNLGTAASTSEWVAYLDDDDEWLPTKTAKQLAVAGRVSGDPVVSCRARSVDSSTGHVVAPIPRTVYRTNEDLATYLFRRRRLAMDRNSVFAPSILIRRELALRVGWNERLSRHQDWDFLLRVLKEPSVTLHQIPDVLITIAVGSPGSVSGSANWEASLDWALEASADWERATARDFIAGQPLRYALSARSIKGVRRSFSAAFRDGIPSVNALGLAAAGLIPRSVLGRLSHRRRR